MFFHFRFVIRHILTFSNKPIQMKYFLFFRISSGPGLGISKNVPGPDPGRSSLGFKRIPGHRVVGSNRFRIRVGSRSSKMVSIFHRPNVLKILLFFRNNSNKSEKYSVFVWTCKVIIKFNIQKYRFQRIRTIHGFKDLKLGYHEFERCRFVKNRMYNNKSREAEVETCFVGQIEGRSSISTRIFCHSI